ncbi:MAG: alpha/beta fold hydrolase [Clostridia bacterium]|nr:alpha/beta fold hydrolase [Clostridia bacterium]
MEWNGFERLDLQFEGREAILICPREPRADKKWLLKTEYFGAFPAFELGMLERGYYLAHMKNISRWCPREDTDARARFCAWLSAEYGLAPQCLPVGMSCGGMQAVYLAAEYPEYVAAVYLDAPVLNLLSCPCALGEAEHGFYEEFQRHMGMTVSDLLNYRNHPIDRVEEMIQNRIPVFLCCGDRDKTVPYSENGRHLAEKYRGTGLLTEILKPGCDHHPHSLEDLTPLYYFAEKYYGGEKIK